MADGSIRKRSNGSWELRFRYKGKQHSVTAATQKECRKLRDEKIERLAAAEPATMTDVTLREYSAERLSRIALDIRPSSLLSYSNKYAQINSVLGDKRICDITRRDVFSLRETLAQRLAPSTVNYCISLLNTTFDDAIADGVISKNPAFRVKYIKSDVRPKAVETTHRALTKDEQDILFNYLKSQNAWLYELFAFQVSTGMRIGECCALQWQDIYDGLIHVHATVSKVGAGQYAVSQSTKTAAGKREIPVNGGVAAILRMQRKKLAEYFGVQAVAPHCRVFVSQRDCTRLLRPTDANRALQWMISKMNRNGIPFEPLSTHGLRDTFATRCIEQGMEPLTLSKLMGHTKIAMTMDLYAHVMKDTKIDAMMSVNIRV